MAVDQGQLGTEEGVFKRGATVRWVLIALVLVLLAFLGRYGWKWYDDYQWQKAMDARKQADMSLPEVSARRLFDAYVKDRNAAISKYSGKRYFVGGRAFDAMFLTGNEFGFESKPAGVAKFTAGYGNADDPGNKYILLSSAQYWEVAYSSLPTGDLDMAACTIDPSKWGIQTNGDDNYIYADDCSTVWKVLGPKSASPFSDH